jgi:predicted ATPase/class 3 adenylate cyclase
LSRSEAHTNEAVYAPYLPLLVRTWEVEAPGERLRALEGSLVSVDLSGFTALSERLAAKGKVGAEELILVISGTFEGLIGIAERHGGDVLKFRGDALLILFRGADHELRACAASADMQWLIEHAGPTRSSVGEVHLRMATGIYSGGCDFYLVGTTHRELLVTGPAATETVRLESAAEAGEIVVSEGTAAALDPAWLGTHRDGARLLDPPRDLELHATVAPPAPSPAETDLALYVPAPLRGHLAVEAGEGEHRVATLAFIRFAGTDGLLAAAGHDAVLEQLELLGEVVCNVADELAITWLESDIDADGGKLYLTAGAPSSAGDDEERMLRAVRRILDEQHGPELRAGVNRGPVFAGDVGGSTRRTFAVMGDTTNLAARLVGRAGPNELYATAAVLDRSRTRFETTHQPYLMKGKERPVTAYAVGPVVGQREEEPREELPLVGRERELAVLAGAVDAARIRQTALVELVGEPGIGKTRLVGELQRLALGFQQLALRCQRYEMSHPFFAFRGLLRTLAGITPEASAEDAGSQLAPWVQAVMPDLAPWLPLIAVPFEATVPPTPETESLDPSFRRDRLHEVVEQFLTRMLMMPTLVVFEDAHWLDDASRFLLRHLAASPTPRPWLVCVTRRTEGEPVLPAGVGTVVELGPLADEDTVALALAAAGDEPLAGHELDAVTARAGGNPLFLRELVAASQTAGAAADLPESIETLITTRIDRLDPGDRLLLRYASVVGPAFDLSLLDEILVDGAVSAVELERWGRLAEFVAWEGADSLRFRHDLFRMAAYTSLSFRRRREIHGRLGAALEQRAADNRGEIAGLLSLHFAEAEEHEKAWRYAVEAGDNALRMHANVVAAELYERALSVAEHLPALPAADVASAWESLGDAAELYGGYRSADEAYGRARGLVAGDAAAEARLLRKEGVIREHEGRYDDALGCYARGLELVGEDEAGETALVELELARAGVRFRQGRFDEAVQAAERAAQAAARLEDKPSLAHAYYLLDLAHTRAGRPENPYKGLALPLYEELDDPVGRASVLNNVGNDAYYEGRWDDARESYAQSGELCERAGDVVGVARARNNEGEILSDQGRLDQAVERFEHALRVWRAAGYRLGAALATSNLGRAAARDGRFAEAHELLERALVEFTEFGSESFARETRARQAEARMLAGEHRAAYAIAGAPPPDDAPQVLLALLERVAGYAALQNRDPAQARRHLEASLAHAREAGARYECAVTLHALAELAWRDGGSDAETLQREATESLEGLGVVALPRVPLP